MLSILKKHNPKQVIVFSNFKMSVERMATFLSLNGYPAMAISSLLSQAQRNRVIELFKTENDKNILVATDVAARGLDIKGVDMVINFELPQDAESYVHRIGRTGRAGAEGQAISLVSDRDVFRLESGRRTIEIAIGRDLLACEDMDLSRTIRHGSGDLTPDAHERGKRQAASTPGSETAKGYALLRRTGWRRLFDERRARDQQVVQLVVERSEPHRQIGWGRWWHGRYLIYTLLADGLARSGRPVLKGAVLIRVQVRKIKAQRCSV